MTEIMMLEVETPLDSLLSSGHDQTGEAAERTERIARGEYNDPADGELDKPSVRRRSGKG
jgi:hypothetical protein